MELYKDKECTIVAMCPIGHANTNTGIVHNGMACITSCAWCKQDGIGSGMYCCSLPRLVVHLYEKKEGE